MLRGVCTVAKGDIKENPNIYLGNENKSERP